MALNKRERLIATVLGVAVAIYVGDYWIVEPYLAAQEQTRRELSDVTTRLQKAEGLLNNRKNINDHWRVLINNGLKDNASDAESVALHALADWAQADRIHIDSRKTDTPTVIKDDKNLPTDFQQMRVTITGTGSMGSIAHLIDDIETTHLPLQLGDIRIASRKDGTDDLTVQLSVNTLIFAPQPPAYPAHRTTSNNGEI